MPGARGAYGSSRRPELSGAIRSPRCSARDDAAAYVASKCFVRPVASSIDVALDGGEPGAVNAMIRFAHGINRTVRGSNAIFHTSRTRTDRSERIGLRLERRTSDSLSSIVALMTTTTSRVLLNVAYRVRRFGIVDWDIESRRRRIGTGTKTGTRWRQKNKHLVLREGGANNDF